LLNNSNETLIKLNIIIIINSVIFLRIINYLNAIIINVLEFIGLNIRISTNHDLALKKTSHYNNEPRYKINKILTYNNNNNNIKSFITGFERINIII